MKKILILLSALLLLAAFPGVPAAAYGSYGIDFASPAYQDPNVNPYVGLGYNGSEEDGTGGECTWFVFGRALEKLGVTLTFSGNATYWTENAAAAGFDTGTEARANAIMVEHYGGYGHVSFVEKVENGCAYITEANYKINGVGCYHEDVIDLAAMTRSGSSVPMSPVDYVYLTDEPEPEPVFRSQSLVLSGQIGLNFYMELPEIPGVDYMESYMTFTVGRSGAEYRDGFDPNHRSSDGTRYGFTCYVNSIQMADTITATFHYGNGKTVSREYSVARYIEFFELNAGSFDARTSALIHAIADYGHYEQIYLADVNGWTVGAEYAEMSAHYAETYDYASILAEVSGKAFVRDLGDSDVEKTAYKLHLDSETTVDVYLTPKDGAEIEASAVFGGRTYTAVMQGDGRYLVRIPNISAHQLGNMITVSGTAGSAFTVRVSALSYVRSVLNSAGSNKAAKDGLSALYAYYAAVSAYRS